MRASDAQPRELTTSRATLDRWPWCTCPPDPAQLTLFESDRVELDLDWQWPLVETSCCGRIGFWFRRTPDVFGDRRGIGPLIVCPDSNIVISLYESLDAVEEGIGLIAGPIVSDEWPSTIDALRDLMGLWWWRDVRFWVDPDLHLRDARKPIRPDRRRARAIAVRQLSRDFFERGRWDCQLPDDVRPEDPVCVLHPEVEPVLPPHPNQEPRWPSGGLDRALVQGAMSNGCHVFLTEDRDILRSHHSLRLRGLAVLRPRELLQALDATGELEPVGSPYGPVPDLSALSRFYSLRSPEDA